MNPKHRYRRTCQCNPCRRVRYCLMGLQPRVELPQSALQALLNACHDFGTIHEGTFPSLKALIQAQAECRLSAKDFCTKGEILIVGQDACYITFEVDDENA